MKQTLTLTLATLVLAFTACKKNETQIIVDPPPPASGDTALVPATTGWERVVTFYRPARYTGNPDQNGMEVFEITKVGGEFHLLYAPTVMTTNTAHDGPVYKGRWQAGSTVTDTTLTQMPATSGTANMNSRPYFIPGSATPRLFNLFEQPNITRLFIYAEDYAYITDSQLPINIYRNLQFFSDEVIIAGGMHAYNASNELDLVVFGPNGGPSISSGGNDSGFVKQYLPFRWSDKAIGGLCVQQRPGNKYSLAVKDCFEQQGWTPEWKDRFESARPEFTSLPVLLKVQTVGDQLMALVGTLDATKTYINKVWAYSWQRGTTTFQTLYAGIPVSKDFALKESAGRLHISTLKMQNDGTIYDLVPHADGYALHTLNGSGEKTLGFIASTAFTRQDADYALGAVSYIDGYYYAAVYPLSNLKDNAFKPRAEVIRLKP